jgi:trigger factor
LKTTVEKLEGDRVRLTIEHDAAEVDKAIAGAYTRVAQRIKLPGFRPGKAPRALIDTHVGREGVLADALEALVEDSYPRALDANRLHPVERPDTGELDLVEEGKPYTFTAEVDLKPELTLSSIEGLTAVVAAAKSTEAEIDAQIDYLRDRFATLEVVEDRGIQKGDFALLSFSGTVDGQPADDLIVDKYLYEVGAGIMPPEFDEGLVGAKPGETVTVGFEVPGSAANPAYVGKPAIFDVEIFELKAKTLPEPDDEWAAQVSGLETIAALRDDIRSSLDENKASARVRLAEREARVSLAARLEGEVPAALVDARAESMTEEFYETLAKRGMTPEDYEAATGVPSEAITDDLVREASVRVKEELALEALYRQAGLAYTDEDIDAEVATIAAADKVDVVAMRDRLILTGVMAIVRERLVHRLATRWLMDHVELLESAPDAEAEAADAGEAKPKKGTSTKKASTKKKAAKPAVEE